LTKELLSKIPKLYESEMDPDPMVVCKFFYPSFHWTWYVIEFDGNDLFFGFVDGDFPEMGYFTFREMLQTRGAWGSPLERDRHFKPCRMSELRAQLKR